MTEVGFNYRDASETGGCVPLRMWTRGVPVEPAALAQLDNLSTLPFIHRHIAVMPDVHLGIGATVGSVIATKGAIVPAAVGVDIGCGMIACRTQLRASDLPDSLSALRSEIEAAVPHGRTNNGGQGDRGAWHNIPLAVVKAFVSDGDSQDAPGDTLNSRLNDILGKHPKLAKAGDRSPHHLGTLGSGNHFIEVCLDETDAVWVMLHSGSRGIGNAIGNHFIERAKRHMEKWFVNLPDKALAYLPESTQDFDDYIEAVGWAQDFAATSRRLMMAATLSAMARSLGISVVGTMEAVNCHHNYVSRERHFGENVLVTRKGAVRAREGDLGIIPGSMGARSYIVRGKGNRDSFDSCSHGAGRVMSRTAARNRFTVEDHIAATAGIECRKDVDVLDETPAAYKDIDAVMAAQTDLVSIEHTLRQVLCVKG